MEERVGLAGVDEGEGSDGEDVAGEDEESGDCEVAAREEGANEREGREVVFSFISVRVFEPFCSFSGQVCPYLVMVEVD